MRNLVYSINLSLDGCCDHAILGPECMTDELAEYHTNFMQDVDLMIFGRITYDIMVPYWPDVAKDPAAEKSDRDFAEKFVAMDKIVVSRSLVKAEANTRIIHTNPGDELLRLKKEKGKRISVGGVDLAEQLIALGLVDEFFFVILPIIVGKGRRLMAGTDLAAKLNLKLVGSKNFAGGAVALHYVKGS